VGHARDHVRFTNCYTTGDITGAGIYTGGIVGYTWNNEEYFPYDSVFIYKCYTTGNITSTDQYVGGLAGYATNGLRLYSSYATGNISGHTYVGGLVGSFNTGKALVENCYATGDVTAQYNTVGGLVGNAGGASNINNSYATGKVQGEANVGGLVGYGSAVFITNCFALNPSVTSTSTLPTVTAYGRISGNLSSNPCSNYALSCMRVYRNTNVLLTEYSTDFPTPALTNKNGADITIENAINPNAAAYTALNWDFDDMWTFDYDYTNAEGAPWKVKETTNLPILQVFTVDKFSENAEQPPFAECLYYVTYLPGEGEPTGALPAPELIVEGYLVKGNVFGFEGPEEPVAKPVFLYWEDEAHTRYNPGEALPSGADIILTAIWGPSTTYIEDCPVIQITRTTKGTPPAPPQPRD
jgi:hypothetical protein